MRLAKTKIGMTDSELRTLDAYLTRRSLDPDESVDAATLCPMCGTDDPEAHGCNDCGRCPCRCKTRCSACFVDIEFDDYARRGLCLECQADEAEARAEEF
jgi:hypothetical protein